MRLTALSAMAVLCLTLLFPIVQVAAANPLSDISREKWAYQAIQSLAADGIIEGYPDGTFKGDRPLSRSEMAVIVARAIAKVQAGGASKADVQKVQELINGLKDELDGLGVRVTNLEDSMQALDARTKVAQAITLSADLRPNMTFSQALQSSRTIANFTAAACTPPTAPTCGATSKADAFVTTFLLTDPSNNFFDPALSGLVLRYNDKFSFGYRVNDNVQVSFPIRIVSYEFGGPFERGQHYGISPGVTIDVAKSGNISNFIASFGDLETMKPSLAGLAFRPPEDSNYSPYGAPLQAFPKGVAFSGTLNGVTDIYLSIARLDQTYLYSSNGSALLDPNGYSSSVLLFPVTPPAGGYVQTGPPGNALTSNTFTAGTAGLQQIFLLRKAILGSVYISSCNGARFNAQGQFLGGRPPAPGSLCAGVPGLNFSYNDAYNSVAFSAALPPGSTVTLTYMAVDATNNTNGQRYMVTSRINHQIPSFPGASIGVTFNRIFDVSGVQGIDGVSSALAHSVVSDTVFGLDFQVPLLRRNAGQLLFVEGASSRLRSDEGNAPGLLLAGTGKTDSAIVFGLKLRGHGTTAQIAYQTVGSNFLSGTPFRYFGNSPNLFSYSTLPYFPGFFGIGNNLGINRQLDIALGAGSKIAVNPALTYAYPIFNPFVGFGPNFYSAYVPNTQGITASINSPVRIGRWNMNARLSAQHLQELTPNSFGSMQYCLTRVAAGCAFRSSVKERDDSVSVGTAFNVAALGKRVTIDLSGTYERLSRNDRTGFPYVPYNPATQSSDAGVTAALPGVSPVTFYPNFVDVKKKQFNASAALPLTKNMTVNLQYNTQMYVGAYGTTLSENIAQRKDYYLGNVTYTIPRTNSAIVLSARQYTYRDNYVPTYNLTQNRQDLNFTVKF